MKNINHKKLKPYIMLWSTQSLSALGSGMTSYALVLWLYLQSGSALKTALLSVFSYAPYVAVSVFAGALSDRWNKKRVMLICDFLAAITTVIVYGLIKTNALCPWHLYVLNMLNSLMNTVQQPAGEVAATLLVPKEYYQKTSGLRSFSRSLNSILQPVLATALFSFGGMEAVILADLTTFAIAFLTLSLFIHIPEEKNTAERNRESLLASAAEGLKWLKRNPLILNLMMFLAFINLTASIYNAALPAMVLSKANGGKEVLGLVNTCVGLATLAGSLLSIVLPEPKNRVKTICITLFISMSTENFLLAFGNSPVIWCIGAVLGWLPIPLMDSSLDVIYRSNIPSDIQGRVYSCRNSLQFFTIPVGFLAGGILIDKVFEPIMSVKVKSRLLTRIFGYGKGSGAAMLFFVLGVAGVVTCFIFSIILKKFFYQIKKTS